MRIGFSLGTLLEYDEVLKCAVLADKRGVESIWIPESWGREAFVTLGTLATLTKRALLGTGIIGIYSRSSASIAMAAATLDALSNGRALLGLGASSKAIVENWHGMRFANHITRMQEYVDVIKMICKGDKVSYKGKFAKVNNFKLGFKPIREHIPIYIAAVNDKMLKLSSSIADGTILFLRPIDNLKVTVSQLKASRKKFDVACVIMTAVSKDAELARERVRKTLSFYIAVGRIYSDFVASHGFENEVEQITHEYKKHGLENIHKHVSDHMLDSITITGTPEECRKKLRKFMETGISLPIIQFNPVGETENSFKEVLSTLMED
jgi:alkanesulfonate monooxygenase SsuD/methylene tetrahydromethanopterin reductase-like flavin-dependent oxidoreductase (luciferase family)